MIPPEVLEQLSGRVEDLERRVAQLEQRSMGAPDTVGAAAATPHPPQVAAEGSWQFGPVLTVVGIALLGVAGGYVLRALAGTALLPRVVLGLAGAAYAVGWAIAAVRNSRRFAGGVYAATSVLMLGPMLWEMSLRFQAMSSIAAAAILAANLVAIGMAARGNFRSQAFSFAFAGSAVTALALCIGARNMVPLIGVLAAMLLFCEWNRMRGQNLPIAGLVALTADAAILVMLFIYRMPATARPEYPALSPAIVIAAPILLLVIQAASVAYEARIRRQPVAVADAVQTMAAFLLLALGAFWTAPRLGASAVGSLCVVLCAGCYWMAYDSATRVEQVRNYRLFSTWALLLLIAGAFLLLEPVAASVALSFAGIAAFGAARRLHSGLLQAHALIYLIVGVIACGLPQYEGRAMLAGTPSHLAWSLALIAAICVASFIVCGEDESDESARQVISVVLALLAACAACAFLTHGLVALAGAAFPAEVFHVALLRTFAICVTAMALAVGGVRMRRPAMTRVAYVLLVFVVLKLGFEDLRHGHLGFLAASIGIVAVTLIAVPRVAARSQARG